MNNDIQKPILYKAEPDLFVEIENLKDTVAWRLNRNRFLNEAVQLYIELIKLMQRPEYSYINEVSFNDERLQRILFYRLKRIANEYRPTKKYI